MPPTKKRPPPSPPAQPTLENATDMLAKPKAFSWFPGHMRKAQRRIEGAVKQADVFIEIRDARLPGISANPWIDAQAKHCLHVVIMNKAQLAHQACSKAWQKHLHAKGVPTLWLNILNPQHIAQIEKRLHQLLAKPRKAIKARGLNPPAQRLIVGGAPNVGKSTLINRLLGSKRQAVSPLPGVTRNTTWVALGNTFLLMDTPGMMLPRIDNALDALLLSWVGLLPDRMIGAVHLAENLLDHLLTAACAYQSPKKATTLNQPPFDNPAKWIAMHYGCIEPTTGWQNGAHILRTMCEKRGFLQQGGVANLQVGASQLLQDFRKGALGQITLQLPP